MKRAGFTLVEVLLAGLLMGIVVLATFTLYSGTAKLGERSREGGDMLLQSQFAFRRMESDLRAAWVSTFDDELKESMKKRMNAGLASAVTSSTVDPEQAKKDLAFTGQSGTHPQGDDDYLELICAAGSALGETKGDLVRARYYILRDGEFPHRSCLVRDARPFMTPRLGGTDRAIPEDEVRVIARGVVGLKCRYRRGTGGEKRSDWDSAQQNGQWPTVVEVDLTFQTAKGVQQKFETKAYLRVPAEFEDPDATTTATTEEKP